MKLGLISVLENYTLNHNFLQKGTSPAAEIFTNLNEFVKLFKAKEEHFKVGFVTIGKDLDMLTKNFRKYFMTYY